MILTLAPQYTLLADDVADGNEIISEDASEGVVFDLPDEAASGTGEAAVPEETPDSAYSSDDESVIGTAEGESDAHPDAAAEGESDIRADGITVQEGAEDSANDEADEAANITEKKSASADDGINPVSDDDGVSIPSDATPLSLNTSYSVSLNSYTAEAWFSFTPETTDYYEFASSDNSGDPYVTCYRYDQDFSCLVSFGDDDDSGTGYNFSLCLKLEAGTTYFFAAEDYESEASYSVKLTTININPYDISTNLWSDNIIGSIGDSTIYTNGSPITFDSLNIEVKSTNNQYLAKGTDYKFVAWYAEEWDSDSNSYVHKEYGTDPGNGPSEDGSYYVLIEGNGSYTGQRYVYFYLVNAYDISNGSGYLENEDFEINSTIKFSDMGATVFNCDGETLTLDKDYIFDGWYTNEWDSDSNSYVHKEYGTDPGNGPSGTAGWYFVGIKGIGDYTGEIYLSYIIYDPNDLYYLIADRDNYLFQAGTAVKYSDLGVTVYAYNSETELTYGKDYEFGGWYTREWDSNSGSYVYNEYGSDADNGPSRINTETNSWLYYVKLVGKEDYHGETYLSFGLYDPQDISCGWHDMASSFTFNNPLTLEDLGAVVYDWNYTILTYGKDYEVGGWYLFNEDTDKYELAGSDQSLTVTEAGDYYAKIVGIGNYTGYQNIYFTIDYLGDDDTEKDISSSTVTLADESYTYDGTVKSPSITVKYGSETLTEGTDYTVSGTTSATELGTYTITITGIGNYTGEKTVTWTIEKAKMNVKAADVSAYYDGGTSSWSIEVTGAPEGAEITYGTDGVTYSATNPSYSEVGTYTVYYRVTCDDYEDATGSATITISRFSATEGVEYSVNSNDWINTDFVVSAAAGYEISVNESGWTSSLSASAETAGGTLTFYVRNSSTGAISSLVTETYKIDKTAPTGSITVRSNIWKEFLNTVTFGIFFNDTQTVKIEGEDSLSGISAIDYYVTDTALGEDGVKALADSFWTSYDSLSISPDGNYVIYARISDAAGNVIYISSDGMILNSDISGTVSGTSSGNDYYGDTTYSAKNENAASVTVDGVEITLDEDGNYVIEPDNKLHTIEEKDANGNVIATYDIYVYEIPTASAEAEKPEVAYRDGAVVIANVDCANEDAVITYQWYSDEPDSGTGIDGATSGTYNAPEDLDIGTYMYYCVVTVDGVITLTTNSVTVTIVAKDIADKSVTPKAESFTYDGTEKSTTLVIKDGTYTLVEGTDYTISGDLSATEEGSYTITITGIGNYTGETTVTWTISSEEIPDDEGGSGSGGSSGSGSDSGVPDTGDNTNLALYLIFIVMSLAAAGAGITIRRRRMRQAKHRR